LPVQVALGVPRVPAAGGGLRNQKVTELRGALVVKSVMRQSQGRSLGGGEGQGMTEKVQGALWYLSVRGEDANPPPKTKGN